MYYVMEVWLEMGHPSVSKVLVLTGHEGSSVIVVCPSGR